MNYTPFGMERSELEVGMKVAAYLGNKRGSVSPYSIFPATVLDLAPHKATKVGFRQREVWWVPSKSGSGVKLLVERRRWFGHYVELAKTPGWEPGEWTRYTVNFGYLSKMEEWDGYLARLARERQRAIAADRNAALRRAQTEVSRALALKEIVGVVGESYGEVTIRLTPERAQRLAELLRR